MRNVEKTIQTFKLDQFEKLSQEKEHITDLE